ncbi:MAG TPA: hypothetical protein EYP05_00095, partial [Piscirickettsiaceae bacterium]|nr:hypothetical protein [Piscirickettsiaceae bacterium]
MWPVCGKTVSIPVQRGMLILLGLALFLTLFIMQPVFTQVYENA